MPSFVIILVRFYILTGCHLLFNASGIHFHAIPYSNFTRALIHKKSQGCKKINRRLLFKGWRKMGNNMENRQNNIAETFQLFIGDKEMLAKVIECFPYPIEIYAPDGT